MLNEWQEFLNYTEPVAYRASGKKDTAWLGRFTFEALRDFSGMNRILTILARGFLFHAPDGTLLPGDPRERISFAYDGLCAWCSIPERRGAPHEEWQHRTDFAPLHEQFPTGPCSLLWHTRTWSIRTTQLLPGSWTSCLTRSGAAKCFSTRRRASPP